MFKKSSHKKACESFNCSNISLESFNPPWCSGKLTERRKLSPNWEIQSSYPLRENIWEYLHNDKNLNCHSKRLKKTNKPKKCCGRKTKLILLIFLCMMGVIGCLWKLFPTHSSKILDKITPKTKSLMQNTLNIIYWKNSSASEQCCHNMRHLALELSRKEQILRNTRLRLLSRYRVVPYVEDTFIKDLTALGGSETKELYSRSVSLWGFGPLWRESPSPNIVLSVRDPQPADCWAFSGSTGNLHIYLPFPQQVRSISVEHVQPDTAISAPKLFNVFGIVDDGDNTKIGLLKGEYRRDGPAKQYFPVKYDVDFKEIIFNVLSNQGNPKYTCIYRVHLYGHENARF